MVPGGQSVMTYVFVIIENLKLRLVNGRGECEGRVEVYYNGTWGTVCDDSWDLADADVVCRQLRCGHTIHTRSSAFFGSGSGKIWLDDLRCSGSESALSQCPSRRWGQHDCRHKEDAGVMCSGFKQLRLVSESEECSGKLEVFYNGSWGSVCYNNMNKGTAGSFCRHLKCGQQKQITSVTVTDSKVRWLDNVKCYGHEMFIWQCPSSRWGENRCTDSEIAQLTCSDSDKLWLVGGETNCSGRLEVWYSGSWGTICDDSWDLTDAEVVCRQLGCGAAESIPGEAEFGKGTGPIWLDDVSCSGKELVLQDCRSSPWGQHDCSHKEDVQVKCKGLPEAPIRLVNGGSPCAGRVEVYHNEQWGTVCSDSWDDEDGAVVCKQLGCGAAVEASTGAAFGAGSGVIWLDDVECSESETALWECRSSGWGIHNCGHHEDAGVICSEHKEVRLTGGTNACSGRVEVRYQNKASWTTVCAESFDSNVAKAVCRGLECGLPQSVLVTAEFGEGVGQIFNHMFQCKGDESHITYCTMSPIAQQSCSHKNDVGIICSGYKNYTLVNGCNYCSGRVELQFRDTWGSVCDHGWDLQDADVLCQQSNCGYAIATPGGAAFGEGKGTKWADEFQCKGNESSLWECPIKPSSYHRCTHKNDAGVICSENLKLRLVKGRGECEGRVEVYYKGTWGTVCDDSWDLTDANVVCRQLRCGHAIHARGSAFFGSGSGKTWLDDLRCSGSESALSQCPSRRWGQHDCSHKEDAGVMCSGFKQLRLVSESEECSGKLEVFYNGSWGSVCSNNMSKGTADSFCRHLTCGHQKQITSVTVTDSKVRWLDNVKCYSHETFIWQCPSSRWGENRCTDSEIAQLTCSEYDKLRLVGGETKCSGRLEVWYNGSWGTVCDDSWDLTGAEVICRQLGCGVAESIPGEAEFGKGTGRIWLDEVRCNGRELVLQDCRSSPWGQNDCSHKEDVQVKCKVSYSSDSLNKLEYYTGDLEDEDIPESNADMDTEEGYDDVNDIQETSAVKSIDFSDDVRVVNGGSPCAGTVEVYKDQWRTVCDNDWNSNDAAVVCRQLGCGSVTEAPGGGRFGPGSGKGLLSAPQCRGSESKLTDCSSNGWRDWRCLLSEVAGVICSGPVQLKCSVSRVLDRVLIFLAQFLIFSNGGSYELGHKVPDRVNQSNWRVGFSTKVSDGVRLVNGGSPCAGTVEVYKDRWRTVCDDDWNSNDAAVVCRQLGCGSVIEAPGNGRFGAGSGRGVLLDPQCRGSESKLTDCSSDEWSDDQCSLSGVAGVICSVCGDGWDVIFNISSCLCICVSDSDDVRLVNGGSPCAGTVEVYKDRWRTVCDGDWNSKDAAVVCKQLDCGSVIEAPGDGRFGPGTGQGVLLYPWCTGSESTLTDCSSGGWYDFQCPPSLVTGVICSGYKGYRLVNGSDVCSGRVEIQHGDTWGTLCDHQWDLQDANVLCQQLHCGYAVNATTGAYFGEGQGHVRRDHYLCNGAEKTLSECPVSTAVNQQCSHRNDAGVICSGKQNLPKGA
ncbi:deleted in malignant brain tumors 1 protein-like [Latimeria chalumnae]|uniref:deleted in malignant brain tumors 1 protein-like n=1 Tax=Latimeria chalumnae TaxID=7897 RepID=UPI00313C2085